MFVHELALFFFECCCDILNRCPAFFFNGFDLLLLLLFSLLTTCLSVSQVLVLRLLVLELERVHVLFVGCFHDIFLQPLLLFTIAHWFRLNIGIFFIKSIFGPKQQGA